MVDVEFFQSYDPDFWVWAANLLRHDTRVSIILARIGARTGELAKPYKTLFSSDQACYYGTILGGTAALLTGEAVVEPTTIPPLPSAEQSKGECEWTAPNPPIQVEKVRLTHSNDDETDTDSDSDIDGEAEAPLQAVEYISHPTPVLRFVLPRNEVSAPVLAYKQATPWNHCAEPPQKRSRKSNC